MNTWKIMIILTTKRASKWNKKHFPLFRKCSLLDIQNKQVKMYRTQSLIIWFFYALFSFGIYHINKLKCLSLWGWLNCPCHSTATFCFFSDNINFMSSLLNKIILDFMCEGLTFSFFYQHFHFFYTITAIVEK